VVVPVPVLETVAPLPHPHNKTPKSTTANRVARLGCLSSTVTLIDLSIAIAPIPDVQET